MAHAFTPGLKVTEQAIVRRARRLPLLGEVLAGVGDRVRATDVVARTALPGKVYPVNLANHLGVLPEEIPAHLRKQVGEQVAREEILAESPGFFGMFKTPYRSPIDGTLDAVSSVTGQVMLRGQPTPVEVEAYVDGTVTEVLEGEGVVVSTAATLIQGIFGLGGERQGAIRVVCDDPADELTAEGIDGYCKGKIVVGGAFASLAALRKAFEVGATGVIVGGFDYGDIKALLGYEVGVAITGGEKIPTTLIVTEGFGRIAMARRTHAILKRHEEHVASINGATQIRAGVIRPEVIVARPDEALPEDTAEPEPAGLDVGALIRVIRFPHFGRIGKVTALPTSLERMASETEVRVLEVTFEDGETAILPRANIEMIEA